MAMAKEVLTQHEGVDNAYDVHINNFISKVKSLAKSSKVLLLVDIEEFGKDIKEFVNFNLDRATWLVNLEKEIKRKKQILHVEAIQDETLGTFKSAYLDACMSLIKTMKRISKESIDWRDLTQILGALEVTRA